MDGNGETIPGRNLIVLKESVVDKAYGSSRTSGGNRTVRDVLN